jgi:hypothetical protein
MRIKTKQNITAKILSGLMLGFALLAIPLAHAQEEGGNENGNTLYEPIEKQVIQLGDEGAQENWNVSQLETYGIKILIRGKDALTWVLNIEDSGFHNPAIEQSYHKVLTIVNSLFILGLLVIAAMWMFSVIIPRKYLKKIILIYCLTVILINFALPVNQLFIDGTNLLQKTLLTDKDGGIGITDIVQTPAYDGALSYRNEEMENIVTGNKKLTLDIEGEDADLPIGKISIPGQSPQTIALTSDPVTVFTDSHFSVFQEQTVFRFLIMLATALAYLIIALIFVLRIVILWALLILSPLLLVLAIFRSTRGWFWNWIGLYGRWLLIGPIIALGIAIIVNIWQLSGLPITVNEAYSPEVFSAVKDSNILFYLPGKTTANTLSNTQEMMEYMIFLIMLYLPIFMAFALTRQKFMMAGVSAVSGKILARIKNRQLQTTATENDRVNTETNEKQTGIVENIKYLVGEKIGLMAENMMSINKLRTAPEKPTKMMESASNFLPERLKETPVPKILELLGKEKGSKKSHARVIEKLARLEQIKDRKEREQVRNVLNEITERSEKQDKESMAILREMETFKEKQTSEVTGRGSNASSDKELSDINIHIGESKPEENKSVRDRSFNEENGKKNVRKKKKHHHRGKKHKKQENNLNKNAN